MTQIAPQRVDVRTFGGFLDGVHNDGPALRAAVEHIRTNAQNQPLYWTGLLLFAAGEAAVDAPAGLVIIGGENDGDSVIALGGNSATANTTVFNVQAGRSIQARNITLQGPSVLNGKLLKFINHAGGSGNVTFERVLSTGLGIRVDVAAGATFVQSSINELVATLADVVTYQGDSVWIGANNGSGVVLGAGVAPSYGEIYIDDGVTTQITDVAPGTFDLVTGFNTAAGHNGLSNNCTNDKANNKITALVAGVYEISYSISFSGSTTERYHTNVYVGANGLVNLAAERTLGSAGDTGVLASSGFATLAAGDVVTLRIACGGASKNFTPGHADFTIQRIQS